MGEKRNQVSLRLLSDDWCDGTQEAGHSCMHKERKREEEREVTFYLHWPVQIN